LFAAGNWPITPGRSAANGWEKASLKPGDVITAMGYQFTDAQKILRLQKI